jgi:ribonuclease Z
MMEHLPKAFAVDIRVRSKNYPAAGVRLEPHEIAEGVVLERDGVMVTAFAVDHGGEELTAYGYRVDYGGRAAVLSGDTTFNENLIRYAGGADLLIHEVTAIAGSAAESAEQLSRISANHTTPEQAATVFSRVTPKLAVYNHLLLFGGASAEDLIPATRKYYPGPLRVGEDLLRIEVGDTVETYRFGGQPQGLP